jgi:hypothetical protein
VLALHPGTVDTALSSPFQGGLAEGQLQTPAQSAAALVKVMLAARPAQSGQLLAYDGQAIAP